jgi:hypothetical protein
MGDGKADRVPFLIKIISILNSSYNQCFYMEKAGCQLIAESSIQKSALS